jgi:hypothetical protein
VLTIDVHEPSPRTVAANGLSAGAVTALREGLGQVYELIKQSALDRGICVSVWKNPATRIADAFLVNSVNSEIDTPDSQFISSGIYFYNRIGTSKDPKPMGYSQYSWIDIYNIEIGKTQKTCVSESMNLTHGCTGTKLIGGHTSTATSFAARSKSALKIRKTVLYYTYNNFRILNKQRISSGDKCLIIPICGRHNVRASIVMRAKRTFSALKLTDFGN